jgi:dipeptidyl aminopeptidase/acylaminoacyl peptidase
MTDPRSSGTSRWLSVFCALACVLIPFRCGFPIAARAQNLDLDRPTLNIDEDISAFAYARDGRIVFSIRRQFHTKQYDLERDDVWIQETNGKRRRLLQGEKFLRGNMPFTYTVDSFRWSPNGHLILAQLFTTTVDEAGKPQDSAMTLALEDSGKELHLGGRDNLIPDARGASWLLDNSTIVFLTEAIKPKVLYSFRYINIAGGPAGNVFEGRTFLDATPVPHSNWAIAVERDRTLTGPPRLQRLELLAQDDHELATLDGYGGGISVSPSGKKVAYYLDKEVLEVRDLTDPTRIVRLRVGLGTFQWALEENRILLKRSVEKKSGDLVWIDIPVLVAHPVSEKDPPPVVQPTPVSILHGLTFRDFAISPDGHYLAVIAPGKRNLLAFPLPPR